jgi:hypothetical protein
MLRYPRRNLSSGRVQGTGEDDHRPWCEHHDPPRTPSRGRPPEDDHRPWCEHHDPPRTPSRERPPEDDHRPWCEHHDPPRTPSREKPPEDDHRPWCEHHNPPSYSFQGKTSGRGKSMNEAREAPFQPRMIFRWRASGSPEYYHGQPGTTISCPARLSPAEVDGEELYTPDTPSGFWRTRRCPGRRSRSRWC